MGSTELVGIDFVHMIFEKCVLYMLLLPARADVAQTMMSTFVVMGVVRHAFLNVGKACILASPFDVETKTTGGTD